MHNYRSRRGAIRGEYSAAERTWWFFGPVWYTRHAVRALTPAGRCLQRSDCLEAAEARLNMVTAAPAPWLTSANWCFAHWKS